jgi:hypothetical protein
VWAVEGVTTGRAPADNRPQESTLTPGLLIDVAARYNEALLANVDALDVALIAILGVDVAFAVFAIDKLQRLDCRTEWSAITCILFSACLCMLGYACTLWVYDNIAPEPLIADYRERGEAAMSAAIGALARRGRQNALIRGTKRIFALTAVMVFIVGGWTVAKPVIIEGAGDSPSPAACKVVQ